MMRIILCCILLISFGRVQAQYPPSELVFHKFLQYSADYLPEDLLSAKTVVVVHTPTDPLTGVLIPWKEIAAEAHQHLRILGVDAVKYYHTTEILAGPDVRRAIATELEEREIGNIVLLALEPEPQGFTLITTPFSGDVEFILNSQPAWYATHSSLELLFRELARKIDGKDLVRENLLIIDVPEYIRQPNIIRGRRNARYNTDLRIDKLAVPKFDSIPIPENIPQGEINDHFAQDIKALNALNTRRNIELAAIFSQYPYEYELVEYAFDEQSLRTKNFQFIVMMLHGTVQTVREYLQYPAAESGDKNTTAVHTDGTGNTSELTMSGDQTVYKVYIKHIYTGDIYLGDVWDAASTWQQALQVHLNRLLLQLR